MFWYNYLPDGQGEGLWLGQECLLKEACLLAAPMPPGGPLLASLQIVFRPECLPQTPSVALAACTCAASRVISTPAIPWYPSLPVGWDRGHIPYQSRLGTALGRLGDKKAGPRGPTVLVRDAEPLRRPWGQLFATKGMHSGATLAVSFDCAGQAQVSPA